MVNAAFLVVVLIGSLLNDTWKISSEKKSLPLEKEKNIVVIGTGAAGLGFVKQIIKQKSSCKVIWISADIDKPYNRTQLNELLSNKVSSKRFILFDRKVDNLQMILGNKVVDLDATQKIVRLADSSIYAYDYLFLATGSTPRVPCFDSYKENLPIRGIFNFYSFQDVQKINQYIQENKITKAAVLGVGITGLEVADALHSRGLCVTLVDRNEYILSSYLDSRSALMIENELKKCIGIERLKKVTIKKILEEKEILQGIELTDGTQIIVPLLINVIGVKPALELAEKGRLKIVEEALVVDETMRTSDQCIYAGGDIVRVYDQSTRKVTKSTKWYDAMEQGRIAALNILGITQPYKGAFIGYRVSFFNIKLMMGGIVEDCLPTYTYLERQGMNDHGQAFYHKIILDHTSVKGFILVNNTKQAGRLRRALKNQIPFHAQRFFKTTNQLLRSGRKSQKDVN